MLGRLIELGAVLVVAGAVTQHWFILRYGGRKFSEVAPRYKRQLRITQAAGVVCLLLWLASCIAFATEAGARVANWYLALWDPHSEVTPILVLTVVAAMVKGLAEHVREEAARPEGRGPLGWLARLLERPARRGDLWLVWFVVSVTAMLEVARLREQHPVPSFDPQARLDLELGIAFGLAAAVFWGCVWLAWRGWVVLRIRRQMVEIFGFRGPVVREFLASPWDQAVPAQLVLIGAKGAGKTTLAHAWTSIGAPVESIAPVFSAFDQVHSGRRRRVSVCDIPGEMLGVHHLYLRSVRADVVVLIVRSDALAGTPVLGPGGLTARDWRDTPLGRDHGAYMAGLNMILKQTPSLTDTPDRHPGEPAVPARPLAFDRVGRLLVVINLEAGEPAERREALQPLADALAAGFARQMSLDRDRAAGVVYNLRDAGDVADLRRRVAGEV